MGTPRFTPEFKEEAVRQITERGYSVAEVPALPLRQKHLQPLPITGKLYETGTKRR